MDDTISRKTAIDAVEKESQIDGAYGYMDTKSIVDLLNDLPSAQPDWELFDLITSAYYGKMMYSKQDHGLVYSRYSGKYMTVDDAVREFVRMLSWEGEEG